MEGCGGCVGVVVECSFTEATDLGSKPGVGYFKSPLTYFKLQFVNLNLFASCAS